MKQPIYDIIDDEFENFMFANKQLLDDLPYDQITNVAKKERINGFFFSAGLLEQKPFNIMYIGKRSSGEGDFYILLNKEMDKIYTYFEPNEP